MVNRPTDYPNWSDSLERWRSTGPKYEPIGSGNWPTAQYRIQSEMKKPMTETPFIKFLGSGETSHVSTRSGKTAARIAGFLAQASKVKA